MNTTAIIAVIGSALCWYWVLRFICSGRARFLINHHRSVRVGYVRGQPPVVRMPSLTDIVQNIDVWAKRLSAGTPHWPSDPEAHETVYQAIAAADRPTLDKYQPGCVWLAGLVCEPVKLLLQNQPEPNKAFWLAAVKEAAEEWPPTGFMRDPATHPAGTAA